MADGTHPLYLANQPVRTANTTPVTNKLDGTVAFNVAQADSTHIEQAIAASVAGFNAFRRWPAWRRKDVLHHVTTRLHEERDAFVEVLAIEAGKPLAEGQGELTRAIDTFRIATEEATRIHGEWLALDDTPRSTGYQAIARRMPIGPCSFITPFNFPVNLAAHKIGPALAAGCSFVVKPPAQAPVSTLMLGAILAETDLPDGVFSILPCDVADAGPLSTDDRLQLLSFTGSPDVGWMLKAAAGRKPVILELGGNAACIVDANTDIEYAVPRIIRGAFTYAGQSCISVQRLLVHRSHIDELTSQLVAAMARLVPGDPRDPSVTLGPMISVEHAERVEAWIADAVRRGARVIAGGERHGPIHHATLVADVPHDAALACREVFGPVSTIEAFDDFDDALRIANNSDYGLQTGIFTRDMQHAFRAFDTLDVGAVVINDVPSMRIDSMPYGGVKASGLGREGVRAAIDHMTEPRLMILNQPD